MAAESYVTAVGRLRNDVNTLLAGNAPYAWKTTPYKVGTPTTGEYGEKQIFPQDLFNPENKNEMYYFFDDDVNLTEETIVNIDYSVAPTNSIVIINGTLQTLIPSISISGSLLAANDGIFLYNRTTYPFTISPGNFYGQPIRATVLPGEALSFYIVQEEHSKKILFFPGMLQLSNDTLVEINGSSP